MNIEHRTWNDEVKTKSGMVNHEHRSWDMV